ncbi:MAG: hypothetical protein WBA07_04550 [Rivularia sp. (in: cyanobacteria)]
MKSVALTSAILLLTVVLYTPEVNAISIPYRVSDSVINENINLIEADKLPLDAFGITAHINIEKM